ncbi:MAG: helix-turn-helix domain-containing protein [Ramlibacter sp.]
MLSATPVSPADPLVAVLLQTRKSKGLRQQDVADRAGVSRRSLVSIEGGGDFTVSTLRGLCAALGVDIELRPAAGPAGEANRAPSFTTAQDMAAHQAERELDQALRVQAMLPFERSRWLASTWGALQGQALALHQQLAPHAAEGTARHFPTPQAKNQFDEERETAQAVQLALSRGGL